VRFLKAHKLFDGEAFLREGSILVLNDQNLLKDIISQNEVQPGNIEQVEGIITPGFINAHCHLELSHLKEKIPQHTGLPAFAKYVITQRNNAAKEEIMAQMHDADNAMWNRGIVAVGDISNVALSFEEKAQSNIFYHTFIELTGLNPKNTETSFIKGKELLNELKQFNLKGSLAPHAPYSTSKELIKLIADHNADSDLSLSIHNQESEEEHKFFKGTKSGFHDLYSFLNLDLSWYHAPGTSSLQYYVESLSKGPSLLIHNTFTNTDDINLTSNKNIFWCFCPNANKYIENRLPNFSFFSNQKNAICIGTDSLASNTQLDLVDEANQILREGNTFSEENILRALTLNGAKSLGLQDNFGQFIIGKNPGLNQISFKNKHIQFIKKLA
jgi:cytosine/adenosine deaminase-related metal-dependent hydrolase